MAFSINPREMPAAAISRVIQSSAPQDPPSYSQEASESSQPSSSPAPSLTHRPPQLNDSHPPAYTPRDPSSDNSHSHLNELSTTGLPFRSSDYHHESKTHLLLCASGSVATIKIPLICHALSKYHSRLSIRLILTPPSAQFLAGQSEEQPTLQEIAQIAGVDGIYTDEDEWLHPWSRTDPAGSVPILHIELRKWADLMVIAPLSANTMANIVHGMADGLLTSVVRAWDTDATVDGLRPQFKKKEQARLAYLPGQSRMEDLTLRMKKIIVCPAMNTAMWRQPITKKQIKCLREDFGSWIEVLAPMSKTLACGDSGDGAMVDWKVLVGVLERRCGGIVENEGRYGKMGEKRRVLGYYETAEGVRRS